MTQTAGRPSFRRVLSNRSFSLLWLGQLISQSGDFIFDVALLWLVLDLTGSPFFTGVTVAAQLLPTVLVGPVAGVFIDRYDRKRILLVSITLQGAIVAVLAGLLLLHLLTVVLILVLVFALNAGAQFPRATVPALLPRLVSRDDLMPANGLYTFSTFSNQLVSLSLGGLVIAAFGVAFPLYYDAATFFVAVLLIAFVSAAYTQASRLPEGPGSPRPTGIGSQMREGWRFMRGDPVLSELLVLGLTLNVFGGLLLALLAPYARLSLGGSAATYGFLLAVLAGGSIAGAVVVGALPVRRWVGQLLFVGVLAMGGCIAAWGAFPTIPLALIIGAGLGFAEVVANLPIATLFQARVPDHLRGRTIALLGAILAGPQPVGALVAGSLARLTSVDTVLVGSGLLVLVLAGLFYLVLPHLRTASY